MLPSPGSKYFGVAAAIAAVAFGALIWGKSATVIATDGAAQSRTSISPQEMMSHAKDLPVQQIESLY